MLVCVCVCVCAEKFSALPSYQVVSYRIVFYEELNNFFKN